MLRTKLVAGNWKMHGETAGNQTLLNALKSGMAGAGMAGIQASVAVCVPFPYLAQARSDLAGTAITWGAQDVSEHAQGAYTGEVSAAMLRDFDCCYVIVGHSERRGYHGETDEIVAAKADAAIAVGLIPIICVGETLAERAGNITGQVITRQMDAVIARIGTAGLAKAVVAYEPVWAIGTGKTASPEQAQEVHVLIRARVAAADADVAAALRILYGGSMKPNNAKELMARPDIDGGLIGGAALVAADFIAICAAAV
jgi:triosephosphate isomerase